MSQNLQNLQEPTPKICKCQETPCVLQERCDTKNIVYQATVTQNGKTESYVGLCSTPFYLRYRNHVKSFTNQTYSTETKLSIFIWILKRQNIRYTLSWKIIDRGKPFCPLTNECQLCLKEKFSIIFKPEMCTLNSRDEISSHCLHKRHSLLMRTKWRKFSNYCYMFLYM